MSTFRAGGQLGGNLHTPTVAELARELSQMRAELSHALRHLDADNFSPEGLASLYAALEAKGKGGNKA